MQKSEIYQGAADILTAKALKGLEEAVKGEVSGALLTGHIISCVKAMRADEFLQGKASIAGILEA